MVVELELELGVGPERATTPRIVIVVELERLEREPERLELELERLEAELDRLGERVSVVELDRALLERGWLGCEPELVAGASP